MDLNASAIRLQLASFRNDSLSALLADAPKDSTGSNFADLLAGASNKLSADGHNLALVDADSAYQMMSIINNSEVSFKAQYAELRSMGNSVEAMEAAANRLAEVAPTTANDDIQSRIQAFCAEYNRWVDEFAQEMAPGGVLANVQAAQVSVFELKQNVTNVFFGAKDGFRGVDSLGMNMDSTSGHIVFDAQELADALAQNKAGVVDTIDEFSANFAKSADLLNQPDNFIPRQLDNRARAIDYISSHRSSLESEFGTGRAAQPTATLQHALALYEQMQAG